MKLKSAIALSIGVAMMIATPTLAQEAEVVSATPSPTAIQFVEPVGNSVLRAGVEIPLRLEEGLTTKKKKLKVGHRFRLTVSEDVTMNGIVVIPAGTPAIGEVTEVRNKGMWGKSGYIGARVVSLNLNGRNVRITGSFDDKGTAGTAGVVAAAVVLPVVGFFVTGTSAEIPVGTPIKGFLDEDIVFRAVPSEGEVMEIPVPASPQ